MNNDKTFQVRNAKKAAAYCSQWTRSITVRFPFNDYYRGVGRVFTGSPVESRKPRIRDGRVFVKYDCREYEVVPTCKVLVEGTKAAIFWRTI